MTMNRAGVGAGVSHVGGRTQYKASGIKYPGVQLPASRI